MAKRFAPKDWPDQSRREEIRLLGVRRSQIKTGPGAKTMEARPLGLGRIGELRLEKGGCWERSASFWAT